ncbi:MAG: TldD/PmbA family protein, partial [Deltaproteobacteria bacterium]|nr:TldD/PmbA family protein [Deltaproteobacteria bacterium]
ADLAGQGMSVYKDKIGLQVASTLITVVDDSTVQEKRGSFHFDDEGSPAKRTVLVENGILKSYMHDLMSAKKMGAKPTGNGRRESYRNRPIVRMTNTFVTPGKTDPSSIISSVPNGILVKKMGGGQVNTINGDFVFDAQEAYLIENGKATQPVRGATLVGNGPKILMEIDMVGNDLGFGIGTCGKEGQGVPVGHGMPTIRIPSITVGGTD